MHDNTSKQQKLWTIEVVGFVDDKIHYKNLTTKIIKELFMQAMEKLIILWDELVTFVGEKMEIKKCAYYIVE